MTSTVSKADAQTYLDKQRMERGWPAITGVEASLCECGEHCMIYLEHALGGLPFAAVFTLAQHMTEEQFDAHRVGIEQHFQNSNQTASVH